MNGAQKEISKFVTANGGKMRPNFWAVFNSAYSPAHDVMVCVGADKSVSVLEVRHNRNFAHHVGELLKTHKVCRAFEGVALPVTWETGSLFIGHSHSGGTSKCTITSRPSGKLKCVTWNGNVKRCSTNKHQMTATKKWGNVGII